VGLDNIKQDMSLTYIFVISRIYVYLIIMKKLHLMKHQTLNQ